MHVAAAEIAEAGRSGRSGSCLHLAAVLALRFHRSILAEMILLLWFLLDLKQRLKGCLTSPQTVAWMACCYMN